MSKDRNLEFGVNSENHLVEVIALHSEFLTYTEHDCLNLKENSFKCQPKS